MIDFVFNVAVYISILNCSSIHMCNTYVQLQILCVHESVCVNICSFICFVWLIFFKENYVCWLFTLLDSADSECARVWERDSADAVSIQELVYILKNFLLSVNRTFYFCRLMYQHWQKMNCLCKSKLAGCHRWTQR